MLSRVWIIKRNAKNQNHAGTTSWLRIHCLFAEVQPHSSESSITLQIEPKHCLKRAWPGRTTFRRVFWPHVCAFDKMFIDNLDQLWAHVAVISNNMKSSVKLTKPVQNSEFSTNTVFRLRASFFWGTSDVRVTFERRFEQHLWSIFAQIPKKKGNNPIFRFVFGPFSNIH